MTFKKEIFNYYNDFIEKTNNLKEKTEIFLAKKTFIFHIFIMFLFGSISGNLIRITYNGIYDTFLTNAFKLSYLGLAWGETPFIIQVISITLVFIIAIFYAKYIIHIKNKHFYSGVTWS